MPAEIPTPSTSGTSRRILSLVFPQLLCEISQGSRLSLNTPRLKPKPLAVILTRKETREIKPTEPLTAVCPRAYRLGVRPGQSANEASALAAGLRIEVVDEKEIQEKLRFVAEVASRFGSSLCWQIPDTIWLDVSGVGHLFGGEEQLVSEAQEQIRSLGHLVRAVIAPGPRIGQALGRFLPKPTLVVPPRDASSFLQDLPLTALPLDPARVGWFARLGIYSIGQLAELPPKTVAVRLGPRAAEILDLVRGIDPTPLVPQKLPQILEEVVEWEEGVDGVSPLLFAVRGLVARLSARLSGRGEAAGRLECEIEHDRSVARHRGVLPKTLLEFEFASPLYREHDFERVIKSRLERAQLNAPSTGVTLRASQLFPRIMNQVGLGQGDAFQSGPDPIREFSVLLAELQSDVGAEKLGVLSLHDSLLPEERSQLVSLAHKTSRKRRISKNDSGARHAKVKLLSPYPLLDRVTRLLPRAQSLSVNLRVGENFGLGNELYTIERLRFVTRLDGVHWWTDRAARRDYFWADLKGLRGHSEALLFLDQATGKIHLQGWGD